MCVCMCVCVSCGTRVCIGIDGHNIQKLKSLNDLSQPQQNERENKQIKKKKIQEKPINELDMTKQGIGIVSMCKSRQKSNQRAVCIIFSSRKIKRINF